VEYLEHGPWWNWQIASSIIAIAFAAYLLLLSRRKSIIYLIPALALAVFWIVFLASLSSSGAWSGIL
jgi:hypothetical protein